MKTIIVATNFSASCLNAAHYAMALSKQLNINDIVLYHSYALPLAVEIPLSEPFDVNSLYKDSLAKLTDLKESLVKLGTNETNFHLITNEYPLSWGIQTLSEQFPESLAIMSVSEKSKTESVLIGNNTASMIKEATIPLLIVPLEQKYKQIKKVIYACDLKRISDDKLEQSIKGLVHQLGAHLVFLNVAHNEADNFKPDIIDDIYKLHTIWQEENPDYHYIDRKDVAKGIVEFAKEQQADLLIAVPKTYAFFDRIFHRSVTNKLAFHTQLPLLLLREKYN